MDDNTPQVKTPTGRNRRRSIFLATILVLAIIVAVAVVLVLSTRSSTDKNELASKNGSDASTNADESRGELGPGRSEHFPYSTSPTVDVASTQITRASNTTYLVETTQSTSTYTSIEPDESRGGQEPERSKHVLNDTLPTVDALFTQAIPISNASYRVETTQSTSVSSKRQTTAHSSRQDTTESLLAIWHNTTNTSYSYKLYKELKSFPEAQETCRSVKSQLASTGVRNGNAKSEIVTIISEIRKTVKVKAYVWIGMRINATNSTDWIWSDGNVQAEDSIKSWGFDQPNRIKDGVVEKCVAISSKNDRVKNETGLLHDCPCGKKLPFICERKIS